MAKKRKQSSFDDGLNELAANLAKQERERKEENERRTKAREYQDEWHDAWFSLSGDPFRETIPWDDSRAALVIALADVVKRHGYADVVEAIAERIRRWLRTVEEPIRYCLPVDSLRPLSGDERGDSFRPFLEAMMAAACILKRAIDGQVNPLVPETVQPWLLRSGTWEELGREVSRAADLPLDPVPYVRRARCDKGHEWVIERVGRVTVDDCPTCKEEKETRRQESLAKFVNQLRHAAMQCREVIMGDPELSDLLRTDNARLVHAACQAGLCEPGTAPDEAARRVITWGVGTSGLNVAEVDLWSIDVAVARLKNDTPPGSVNAKHGVALFDAAMLYDDDEDAATVTVKRWSDSSHETPAKIGKCPFDGRRPLYETTEVVGYLEKVLKLNSSEKKRLSVYLKTKERQPKN